MIRSRMKNPRDRLAVSILSYAGLRPSELVALRWSDVHESVIVVSRNYASGELGGGKTATAFRAVELVAPLHLELELYRPARPDVEALVFANRERRLYGLAGLAAGASGIRHAPRRNHSATVPYDCRHGYVACSCTSTSSLPYVAASRLGMRRRR